MKGKKPAPDGSRNKEFKAEAFADVIAGWFEAKEDRRGSVNVLDRYEHLVALR